MSNRAVVTELEYRNANGDSFSRPNVDIAVAIGRNKEQKGMEMEIES